MAKKGISVIGITYYKEIGIYSKYNSSYILPHPINHKQKFIDKLSIVLKKYKYKPVIFISNDEYLSFYIQNESFIKQSFISLLPSSNMIKSISSKYDLYKIAINNNIPVPATYLVKSLADIDKVVKIKLNYPLFVKGNDVNQWRSKISSHIKGFVIKDKIALYDKLKDIISKNVYPLIQEVIIGDDCNNFKGCVLYDEKSFCKLYFSLQKVHHYPIHYGVGSHVISRKNNDLELITKKLFSSLKYIGVGSAEFKFDNRDQKFKLIEINPRYWQQNSLADVCGLNFPYYNYLEALDINDKVKLDFQENYRWINLHLNFNSFLQYRREKSLTFFKWIISLRGKKIISFYDFSDFKPAVIHLYRIILRIIVKLLR